MFRSYLVALGSIFAVLPANVHAQRRAFDDVIFKSGNLEVRRLTGPDGDKLQPYHMIMRDRINFGICIADPKLRRMPTTYYHPQGPLGMVMRKFNWFPSGANRFDADTRLPASLVALGGASGQSTLPLAQMVALWSEPPVAVIGMEAGTPAAYARPYQPFDYYEQTKEVISLHEAKEKDRFFHFIADARARGASLRIFHGEPRQELRKKGPRGYYHVIILEACSGEDGEKFFLNLLTREGIAQCMDLLAEDGILCVHTSHRFIDLPPILAAIASDLKVHVRRGRDMAPLSDRAKLDSPEFSHYTSEWVMLAKREQPLFDACVTPDGYEEMLKDKFRFREQYWTIPEPSKNLWTDKGPNLLHGILRGHPFSMRYAAAAGPWVDEALSLLDRFNVQGEPRRFVEGLYQLPRPIDQWMVQQQLRDNPEVEKLWP